MAIKIVTHWQNFHIDELFAISFIRLYVDKDLDIIRTRDKNVLNEATKDPNVWVLDVGGEYNPEIKNFDHHQKSFNETWADGTPMSTCGIVWLYLKENNYLSQHMNKETISEIEKRVIINVDKQDNGIEFWREAYFIGLFNRQTNDNEIHNRQFNKALNATTEFFKNLFGDIRNDLKSLKVAEKSVKSSSDFDNVVFMDTNNNKAFSKLTELTDKQICVLPYKSKTTWIIKSLPVKGSSSYSISCPMPSSWRGLSDKDLQDVSDVEGMVFCHKTGFMCVFEGTKEDAISLANKIYLHNNM